MPFDWFKKEWEKHPEDSTTYPEDCQRTISEFKGIWDHQIQMLKQFGLPQPQPTGSWKTKLAEEWKGGCKERGCKEHPRYKEADLTITAPTFTLPSYIAFQLRSYPGKPIGPEAVYLGDEADVLTIQQLILKKNLIAALEKYPFRYLNHDPYSFFELANKKGSYLFEQQEWVKQEWRKPGPPIPKSSTLFIPNDLKEERYFSLPELVEIKRRVDFLMSLGKDCMPLPDSFTVTDELIDGTFNEYNRWLQWPKNEYQISKDLLYNMPTVDLRIQGEERIAFKILPDLATGSRLSPQFLSSLRVLTKPVQFAIVAKQGTLFIYLSCRKADGPLIEANIQTYFPNFAIIERNEPTSELEVWCLDVHPSPSHRIIKTLSGFAVDPYQQLFSVLSEMPPNDLAQFTVLFAPVPDQTFKYIDAQLTEYDQRYNYTDNAALKRIKELENKQPAWSVKIQVSSSNETTLETLRQRFLSQYATAGQSWVSNDQPCILNTDELAALVHFPDKTVQCDLLETASMKAKLPPDLYTQTGVVIGKSTARGQTKIVTIPDSVRDRHAYIVGKSGTGKSTLLFNAIRQDIESGHGVAVIDPHGDLVEEVLQYIPQDRIEDTIYFNAADKDHPIGLNILNAQNEDEIGLLADDLLITFKRLSESWGERMENILRYCFHTLLRAEDATFLDIKTLLQNPDYRQQVAASTSNRMLRDFWQLEYPSYPKDAAQPILNRMSKFSLSPVLVGILGQPDSSLNFFDVLQNKKILLVNISKGQIGEDTAQLLGSLLVSQLQLAIMRRAALPKESREPYFLYVDEFQNFTTSAFEKILSEARKYKLCLTLAHQYISQLDEKPKNAILANVGTIVMFQSYPQDAQALRPELGQYEPADVTNLNTAEHQALCKPSTQSKDTFMFQTLAPPPRLHSHAREIIEYTRENYATTPIQFDAPEAPLSPTPPQEAPAIHYQTRPARALPKEFANTGDKILHYVSQAEWLATTQIHELVYSHVSEAARASNASRDLKALVEAKRIKFQNFGKSKIYFTGRQVNPTTHNLAIRDLFAKIVASNYELAEVNFFPQLPGLAPDLAVSFLSEDGNLIKTFWEYDAGTEGIAELLKKVSRYDVLARDALVVFVFNSRERLSQFAKASRATRIVSAVISEFATLDESVFLHGEETASAASGLFGE